MALLAAAALSVPLAVPSDPGAGRCDSSAAGSIATDARQVLQEAFTSVKLLRLTANSVWYDARTCKGTHLITSVCHPCVSLANEGHLLARLIPAGIDSLLLWLVVCLRSRILYPKFLALLQDCCNFMAI